jgi:hypothetical protein
VLRGREEDVDPLLVEKRIEPLRIERRRPHVGRRRLARLGFLMTLCRH